MRACCCAGRRFQNLRQVKVKITDGREFGRTKFLACCYPLFKAQKKFIADMIHENDFAITSRHIEKGRKIPRLI